MSLFHTHTLTHTHTSYFNASEGEALSSTAGGSLASHGRNEDTGSLTLAIHHTHMPDLKTNTPTYTSYTYSMHYILANTVIL